MHRQPQNTTELSALVIRVRRPRAYALLLFIPSLLDLLLAIPEIFGKLVQRRDKFKFEENLELRRAGRIVVTFELSLDCPKRFRYIGGVSKGPSSLLDASKELWEVALHLR